MLKSAPRGNVSVVSRPPDDNFPELNRTTVLRNDLVFSRTADTANCSSDEWPSLVDCQGQTQDSELPEFLDQLEHASFKAYQRLYTHRSLEGLWIQRRKLFSDDSSMHRALFGQLDAKVPQRSLVASNCQLACLLYLGIVFLDHVDRYEREQRFLDGVEALIDQEPGRGISPQHLLIRLLIGTSTDPGIESGRSYAVMRLMLEAKELDCKGVVLVREKLWQYVSLGW